jgi:hypothetical protein
MESAHLWEAAQAPEFERVDARRDDACIQRWIWLKATPAGPAMQIEFVRGVTVSLIDCGKLVAGRASRSIPIHWF